MINCPRDERTIVEKQIPLSQRKICAFWLEALGLVAASHGIIFLLLLLLMMMMMMMMMVIMNSPSAPICFLFAEALVKESHQEIASTISEASLPSGKISTPKKKTKSSVRGDVFGDKGANTHMETTSPGRREMPWLGRLCRLETWVLPACEGLFRGRNKKSTVSTR